jgi:hypothetical protein
VEHVQLWELDHAPALQALLQRGRRRQLCEKALRHRRSRSNGGSDGRRLRRRRWWRLEVLVLVAVGLVVRILVLEMLLLWWRQLRVVLHG